MEYQHTLALEPNEPLDENIVKMGDEKEEKWLEALRELSEAKRISVDTETYGEGKHGGLNPWKGKIRLLQVGLPSGTVILIDTGSPFLSSKEKEERERRVSSFLNILKPILESREVLKIFHNGKFDILFLKVHYGLKIRRCYDTMLASQLIRAGVLSKGRESIHSLKSCIKEFLDENISKKEQNSNWSSPDLSTNQLNYAANDARKLFPLMKAQTEELRRLDLMNQAHIEFKALPAIVEMIFNGMPVDGEKLADAIARYKECQEQILQPFYQVFGDDCQYTMQPEKLQALVQKKLGITVKSTGKNELNLNSEVPSLKALGIARSLKKHIDYIEGMQSALHEGRVRGDINQIAPKGFGRTTCGKGAINGINLQQVPKPLEDPILEEYDLPSIRSLFRAQEGEKILIDDLSQAHLRIATEASQDKNLIEIYKKGKDFHAITASQLAHQQGIEWSPEQILEYKEDKNHEHHSKAKKFRDIAKNVNYGGANIQGATTLQKTARNAGTFISENEAKDGIEAFRKVAPSLYEYQLLIHEKANETESECKIGTTIYCSTRSFSGRLCYLPKMPNKYKKEKLEAKISDVCSVHWTATEADAIKYAIGQYLEDIDNNPQWGARLGILVHDEVDLTVKEDYSLEAAKLLKQRMREGMQKFVKTIPVDEPKSKPEDCICSSWADK